MKTLAERIKDLPKGTKLYSPCYGEVILDEVTPSNIYCFREFEGRSLDLIFLADGNRCINGECMIFPSKEDRDWDKFLAGRNKFDVRTLQPFDKVLVRDDNTDEWRASLFSHYKKEEEGHFYSTETYWLQCVPYNDDTKHVLGTTKQAPEYYITWKE